MRWMTSSGEESSSASATGPQCRLAQSGTEAHAHVFGGRMTASAASPTPGRKAVKIRAVIAKRMKGIPVKAGETMPSVIAMNKLEAELSCKMAIRCVPGSSRVAAGPLFGVTAAYLDSADQIQVKDGTGAKPGEGGQVAGLQSVLKYIAKLRFSRCRAWA